jgi:hypothetical protein
MGSISQQDVLSRTQWHRLERKALQTSLLVLRMLLRGQVVLARERAHTCLLIYEMVVLHLVLVTEWAVVSMSGTTLLLSV